ncbi:CRTAC1 family protein [Pelagicoccus sp. SDUM812005]|uniref:CRTAC1 family protein n=1 Tax=Pelagicoccus sp. SDUM812005 TaxID=3041257 RepID=UPI00280C7853|nr:CRTAC1 family protein [Pelagicoccus sp. SDUM812005]MDQ8180312.1 CRTAC1 family protein [Pelagicoccus sp. SDUM812005]
MIAKSLSLLCLAPFVGFELMADDAISFLEASNEIIPLEDRSRRKWDTPILADLDQDGLMDIILTDHSYRVNLHWNLGGRFSEAVVVEAGDIHGATAGDYDRDGKLDLVIYPGGGNGSNPRQPKVFHFDGRQIEEGKTFDTMVPTRGRVVKLVDFNQDGQLELLANGFGQAKTDQIQKGANFVYALNEVGEFQLAARLTHSDRLTYRMLVTDTNNDREFDVVIYGGRGPVALAHGGVGLAFSAASDETLGDLKALSDASAIVEIDFDNDGDLDLFVTRSEHPFHNHSYLDEECGCFAFFSRFNPLEIEELKIEGDMVFENLQMAFPHFDVLVGEEKRLLEFEVDRHGHKDFRLTPEEAAGWPEERDRKALYIGYLGEQNWRILSDTNSPTSGVIRNVISMPDTLPPEPMPAALLENRDGTFVDVSEAMGISIAEQTTGCAVGDFDNDGWSDLFIVRYGNSASTNEQLLYRNNGGKGFERVESHGIVSQELGATGMAAEAFDYDMDGDLDIMYSNERGRWHLFTNELEPSGNRFLKVSVGDSPSGAATALGAELEVRVGDKIYKRRVGQTSSSYGQPLNTVLHVGLGAVESVDAATVRWTNGETQTLKVESLDVVVNAGE